jgi:hypothetical protein
MFARGFRMAAAAAVIAVLTPSVSHAAQKIDGTYNVNVDAAGNVSVTKAFGMFPHPPSPTPVPTYKVVDARSATLLKALGPASVNLDGSVSGNTIKIRYVNGTATNGSSFTAPIAVFATPGGTAMLMPKKIKNGAQVEILAAAKVGSQTWVEIQDKSAPHVKGWVKIENVSYRIYFALSHGPVTPGATGSIPQ